MGSSISMLLALLAAPPVQPAGTPHRAPSLLVLSFKNHYGVEASLAQTLTEHVTSAVRESRRFSRVITQEEISEVLGVERARQTLDCDATSCMVEISNAMGADLILVGSVSKLGDLLLLQMRFVDARTAAGRASAEVKVDWKDPARVTVEVPQAMENMAVQMGMAPTVAAASPSPRPATVPPATTGPTHGAEPAGSGGRSPGLLTWAASAGAVATLLASVPVVLGMGALTYLGIGSALYSGAAQRGIIADAAGAVSGVAAAMMVLLAGAAVTALLGGVAIWSLL